MKYLRIKIKPISGICSELSSDTFFGQVIYTLDLMGKDVNKLLLYYNDYPFFVVSDFFPKGYAKTPKIPTTFNNTINVFELTKRKAYIASLFNISKFMEEKTLYINNKTGIIDSIQITPKNDIYKVYEYETIHTKVNRYLDFKKDNDFSLNIFNEVEYFFNEDNSFYFEFYVYLNEFVEEDIISAIKLIGEMGYGRKTSIGKGNYEIISIDEVKFSYNEESNIYTLGKCNISNMKNQFQDIYYTPYVKFGKHGSYTTSKMKFANPYKYPYVLADQGAILNYCKPTLFKNPFIGSNVGKISPNKNIVTQGYSLYIPFNYSESFKNSAYENFTNTNLQDNNDEHVHNSEENLINSLENKIK